jgi:RHS repeat-associated protein
MTPKGSAKTSLAAVRDTRPSGRALLARWAARLALFSCAVIAASYTARAQNVQFTQGSVGSGLDNSIQIPIAAYPGRGGASLPVTLYYSSKVWKISHLKTVHDGALPQSVAEAVYAEHSTAGWTTSLDVPRVEWPKLNDRYWYDGKPYQWYVSGDTYRVPNVFIHMPDGSTHELRGSDDYYLDQNVVSVTGTFYALDGSRMRYDSTGATTGTLYMPDGSRYVLSGADAQFIDRNGNTLNYDGQNRRWTDTLGQTLRGYIPMPWPANPQAGQDYSYTPPGYDSPYVFKWRLLSQVLTTPDADGNTPQVKAASSHYLPSPDLEPSDRNQSNFPQSIGAAQSLFQSALGDEFAENSAPTFTYVVGRGQGANDKFDPVVLAEVVLPNSTPGNIISYKFTYNVYGEIDKVVYPTGGYERSRYDTVPALGNVKPPYNEASRGVKSRWVSPNGTGGTDEAQWTYDASLPSPNTYMVKTTTPDSTYTESYRHNFYDTTGGKTFGYQNGLTGLAYDERSYDSAGVMLRRTLTKWDQTQPVVQGPTPNVCCNVPPTSYTAYRNPRPTRSVSLILDTGGTTALAKRIEYFYAAADPDTVNHSNSWTIETTTGLDRTLMTESHFAEGIDLTTAKTSSIDTLWDNYNYPPASSSETVYLSDPAYRGPSSHDRYILGLITSVVLKDSTGQAVSKTETFYDEFGYPLITYSDLGSDPNYIDPVTILRANPTTVRRYTNIAANTYLETHAQFDQYGNPVNFWDARGMQSQKEYAVEYRHAYLTKTSSAVPDPSGQYGSSSAITSSSTHDPVTGQVISTKDANDRETTFSYKIDATHRDPLNRLRQVTRPDNSWVKTYYNDVAGNLYVHTESQFDATTSTHAYVFYDKMGRASRALAPESGPTYVVSEARYDRMGRVSQTSNPFRTTVSGTGDPGQAAYWATGDQPSYWTTNTYDAMGRVRQVTLPDSSVMTTDYTGVYTTVTDHAGRKRRQKTDALGRVVRVDEPDANGDLDAGDRNYPLQPSYYEYDALGNVVRINQGLAQQGANPESSASYTQHRYFKYDALSRLTYEKQAEQAAAIPDQPNGLGVWSRRLTYDETFAGVSYKGLLTTTEDARHVVTTFKYDQLSRPYETVYSDGTPTLTSRYDQARTDAPSPGEQAVVFYNKNRLTEVTTAATATLPQTQQLYDYDLMGRTRRQRQVVDANTYELRYAYNIGGGLVSERYPSGRVVSYGFDAAARLSSVSSGATTYASNMTYKPFGGLESMSLGNGTAYSMSYDDARLQLSSLALTQGSSVVQKYEYKYGAVNMATGDVDTSKNVGQIARIEGTIGSQKQWQQRFSYDTLGRLTSAGEYRGDTLAQTYFLKYGYDVYGNRYQRLLDNPHDQNNNPTNPVAQSFVESGSFDATTNRFAAGQGMTYDSVGNVVSDGKFRQRSFQYDANNRQKQSSALDGTGSVQSVYDGAGQRVAVKAGGVITQVMVYDAAGDLVAEYGGTVSTNGTRYVMGDQQGSTRVVMTSVPVNGQLVASRRDYLPFGEDLPAGVGMRTAAQGYGVADSVRKKYAGMESDDATGMSHTLWREYDSLSARWTAPDPYGGSMSLTSPQSFNRYNYVNNDPVNLTDPAGLMPASEGWGGVSNAWGGDPGFFDCHFGGPGVVAEREAEHDDLVQTRIDGMRAQNYLNKGNWRAASSILGANSGVGLFVAGTIMWGSDAANFVSGEIGQFLLRQQTTPHSGNTTMVIIWDDADWERGVVGAAGYTGHVSYIIMQEDKSYSWEGLKDWTIKAASVYTDERSKSSAGIGFVLDFGAQLNDQFQYALLHAYDRSGLGKTIMGTEKRTYDPVVDNCGEAFIKAINKISKEIGAPKTHTPFPSGVREYIEKNLGRYVTEKKQFPKQ